MGEAADLVPHVVGDITDESAVDRIFSTHDVSSIIHLAALQVPFVRANPRLGASVNVLGTANMFEAAKQYGVRTVVYASSVAALDTEGTTVGPPTTLCGVFKRANEQMARIYYEEDRVVSVGLRPHTVYGVGRDQGVTSAPTTAMLAAAAGVPFTIPYGGACQMQFAADVAQAFIAAADLGVDGARVYNIPGLRTSIADVVSAIGDSSIGFVNISLPFPEETDADSFYALVPDYAETPLEQGVHTTIELFRSLLAEGHVAAPTPEPPREQLVDPKRVAGALPPP